MEPGTPRVFEESGVLWAVDRPSVVLPDGTSLPLRSTVVANQSGGQLVIRHFHLSAGRSNEELLGQELTTG